jgi:septal ring factor EnvC (AmiA/AmiB activator)
MTIQTNVDRIRLELVTELRAKAAELRDVLARVELHISEQHEHAQTTEDLEEMQRLTNAEPFKWFESAKTHLQTGVMHAFRAVEQPTTF